VDGWVKLHRSIKDNWVWKDKPFSKGQAWLDILMECNHKPGKVNIGLNVIPIERGQKLWSIKDMADRWGWSRKKVSSFLDVLEVDNMLRQKRTSKYTLLTIVNYDFYQSKDDEEEHQKNIKRTSREHHGNTNKNDKNDKNIYKDIYSGIADLYNSICKSYPRLTKLSDARKKAIKARLNTYTVEDFKKLFTMAEESDFLKGKNDRNWSATFDWLIKDSNMAKVLDGNYKNSTSKPKQSKNINKFNDFPQREYTSQDYADIERKLLSRQGGKQ
jgi:DNA-binding transcriptional regulator GbsR (MarR family)